MDGEQLWEVVLSDARYASYACDDENAEAPKHRPKERDGVHVQGARARSLGPQPVEHVVVASANPADDDGFATHYRQSVRLLGSLGPQLFIQIDSAGFFCGAAHETSGSSFVLWDLHTQTARTPLDRSFSTEERDAMAAAERATAHKVLDDKVREQNEGAELANVNVTLAALFPAYGAAGIAFDLMFVAPACRTCSDGIWSEYTVAARVPLRTSVKSLGADLRVPASLTLALVQSGLKLSGLSQVSGAQAERAALRRQFVQPPAPPLPQLEPRSEAHAAPADNNEPAPGACAVGAARQLGSATTRVRGLALARTETGYWAAFPSSQGQLTLQKLDGAGTPLGAPSALAMPAADAVHSIHSVARGALVITSGACPDRKRAEKCIQVASVDERGAQRGAQLIDRTGEWLKVVDERAQQDGASMLRLYHYRAPELVRYVVSDDGSPARQIWIDLSAADIDAVDLWAGSADAPRPWALIFDGAGYELYALDQKPARVSGLRAEITVLDSVADVAGIALLYRAAQGGLRAGQLEWNGKFSAARDIAAELPAPFASRARGSASVEQGVLAFARSDAAGRPLVRVEIDRDATRAVVACDGNAERCGVLWASRGVAPEIRFAVARCR